MDTNPSQTAAASDVKLPINILDSPRLHAMRKQWDLAGVAAFRSLSPTRHRTFPTSEYTKRFQMSPSSKSSPKRDPGGEEPSRQLVSGNPEPFAALGPVISWPRGRSQHPRLTLQPKVSAHRKGPVDTTLTPDSRDQALPAASCCHGFLACLLSCFYCLRVCLVPFSRMRLVERTRLRRCTRTVRHHCGRRVTL